MELQKAFKIAEGVGFVIIIIFGIFGFLMFENLIHEATHVNDFKEYTKSGSICLLNIPDELSVHAIKTLSIASYRYKVNKSDYESIKKIENK